MLTTDDGPCAGVQCDICGTVTDIETALELGWLPEYWVGDDCRGPACHACAWTMREVGCGEYEPIPLLMDHSSVCEACTGSSPAAPTI